ncbi:aspartate/glutamate racemase family protein [Burkholderia gladioli]|uniref:aspartate/glutamate racemase family protein n=1 Tax=Burkholderia gladioli TaxID=28095 RepID=UPI00163F7744|nr:amino acid racemase [Burkholderia gladioli]
MIGILGGMGPHAGALLVERLTALHHAARRDQDHPRVLLYSNSQIPNRVDAILGRGPSPVPEIAESLDLLARCGAQFAAIACNTAHVFLDEIRSRATLPVIDMIAATSERLAQLGLHRVALLATEGTVASGLYQHPLEAAGIEVVVPDAAGQALVSAAIYDPLRGIKASASPLDSRMLGELARVSETLLEGDRAQALLIACTDLSIAYRHPLLAGLPSLDALDELAHACLERVGIARDAAADPSSPRRPQYLEIQ